MKSILCASLLILLLPSAYAAYCRATARTGSAYFTLTARHATVPIFSRARTVSRSVFGWAQKAVGQLQSYGKKRILHERNAEHHQVPERSVLSIPLDAARLGRRLSPPGLPEVDGA